MDFGGSFNLMTILLLQEDIDSHDEDDKENLLSIDRENYSDVFNIGIYAQDIFDYYKRREVIRNLHIIHYYFGALTVCYWEFRLFKISEKLQLCIYL